MLKVPKGGARAGSGRKPVLGYLEQLDVGAEYERRWSRAKQAREDKALAAVYAATEYPCLVSNAEAIPLDERADWIASYEGEDHRDDVEGVLREMQGIDAMSDQTPSRLRTITVARPYGLRAEIERDVAAWATERFDRPVSVRMVRSCRTAIRQQRARLAGL